MTQKEKLIKMIQDSVDGCARNWAETIADYLLAHGVIVPTSEHTEPDGTIVMEYRR